MLAINLVIMAHPVLIWPSGNTAQDMLQSLINKNVLKTYTRIKKNRVSIEYLFFKLHLKDNVKTVRKNTAQKQTKERRLVAAHMIVKPPHRYMPWNIY